MNYNRLFSLSGLAFLIFALPAASVADPCVSVTFEYKAASASKAKCGFPECPPGLATGSCSASSPPKIYLVKTIVETQDGSEDGTWPCPGDQHNDWKGQIGDTQTWDRFACAISHSFSGSFVEHFPDDCDIGTECDCVADSSTETVIDSSTGEWSDGTYLTTNDFDGRWFLDCDTLGFSICNSTSGENDRELTINHYSIQGTGHDNTNVVPYPNYATFHCEQLITLKTEYKDNTLKDDAISLIPGYPSTYTISTTDASSAKYTLDTNHLSATCGRMVYHLHMTGAPQGKSYRIQWYESITDALGKETVTPHPPIVLTGGNDPVNGVDSGDIPVEVPSVPETIKEVGPLTATLISGS